MIWYNFTTMSESEYSMQYLDYPTLAEIHLNDELMRARPDNPGEFAVENLQRLSLSENFPEQVWEKRHAVLQLNTPFTAAQYRKHKIYYYPTAEMIQDFNEDSMRKALVDTWTVFYSLSQAGQIQIIQELTELFISTRRKD